MKLTPLLTDHGVVQRHQTIPVWGWTKRPRTRLIARLGNSEGEGISADDGRFLIRLPGLKAGGPHTLTVETLDGSEHCVVSDILVGEVWLASGQSNMQLEMGAGNYAEEIRTSHSGQIRMINVGRRADLVPQSTVAGKWELSSPSSTPAFSAVATFFANRLQDELDIPVGVIHSSWGGSFIETWISREGLLRNAVTRQWVKDYEDVAHSRSRWEDCKENRLPVDPGNMGIERGWHKPEFDEHTWAKMPLPAFWQDHGHNISAVMWFRKRVTLPEHMHGQTLSLHIGCVDKHDITYANGVEVGHTGEGFDEAVYAEQRIYTIPEEQTQGADLLIAVRAYSFVFKGGLTGPAEAMFLTIKGDNASQSVSLAGDWFYTIEHDFGFIDLSMEVMGHGIHNSPYMLFDNMIGPLLPVGIAGVIWYQGESNAGKAGQYGRLLRDLIEDWRYHFGYDMPFGVVQLPFFREAHPLDLDSDWACIREAQADAHKLPLVGVAVTLDCGDVDDIHPQDKKTVGHRLAQWALVDCYGRGTVPGGPLYDSHRIEGNRLRITFRNVGTGLCVENGDTVQALFVGDKTGRYRPAQSVIEGNTLLVWHDDVATPIDVRYAWADNPHGANLVNEMGYPTSPFRTCREVRT